MVRNWTGWFLERCSKEYALSREVFLVSDSNDVSVVVSMMVCIEINDFET